MRIYRHIKRDLFSAPCVITNVDDDGLRKGLRGQYDSYSYISVMPSPVVSFMRGFHRLSTYMILGMVFPANHVQGKYLFVEDV